MPAILTHDIFGQETYKQFYEFIGGSKDEYEAFILGNQGPDPLFYSILVPRLHQFTNLGSIMHSKKPNELLLGFKQSLSFLNDKEFSIGRAYMLGFLGHYILDSNMHPFVYFNEYRLCDAGVEGFGRKNASEVHAVIESELDELLLFTKQERTIANLNPNTELLRASDFALEVISNMYAYVALTVYGTYLPKAMFLSSVKSFRRTEKAFISKSGVKRALFGQIEELFRPYSFVRAMSPRAIELTTSKFDNHEHAIWENPFTGKKSKKSFQDIYDKAGKIAAKAFKTIDKEGFGHEEVTSITHNLDFSGRPTEALLFVENEG